MHSEKRLLWCKLVAIKHTAITAALSRPESLNSWLASGAAIALAKEDELHNEPQQEILRWQATAPTITPKPLCTAQQTLNPQGNLPTELHSSCVVGVPTASIPTTADKRIRVKHLCWKFVYLCLGIACTSVTSALLFQNQWANATTPTVLSKVTELPADQVSNIESHTPPHPEEEWRLLGDIVNRDWKLGTENSELSNPKQAQFLQGIQARRFSLQDSQSPVLSVDNTFLQAQTPPTTPPPITPDTLQPNPNQQRFPQNPSNPAPLQPDSQPSIQPSPSQPSVQPSPTPTPQPVPTGQTIQVEKIEVVGSTVFGPEQFNPIVQPAEGRALTLEQLRQIADNITQLYLDRGYITSRAILVDQEITQGIVQIRAIEGSLEQIQVEGTKRINPDYVRSRVRLGAGTPLNTATLEDQLRLLKADPLFENVEASLRAGSGLGKSILIVRVTEANPFEGSVGIDNYSPPSVGSERLGITALHRNLTGNGDTLAGSFYHTTRSGADNLDFTYRFPVNAMNGAVQLRTAFTWNQIVDPDFTFLGLEGNSQLYEIFFQQPLVRTPREEFVLSLGFSVQDNQSVSTAFPGLFLTPGADEEGYTRTRVIKFGQDYVRRDLRGAWSFRSLFSLGIGALDATLNSNPVPDGRFFSWLGQVQRVQILNENNFLIVGTDIQLTPDPLFPSQQFVIGGGQSLRGYRQNIRAGDNGVRFTIEDRITLQRDESGAATFQLAPFFDAGYVWNADEIASGRFISQRFLAGVGIGVLWQLQPRLDLRFDYAYPIIDLDDRGENAQDNGIYFSVRYRF
jgi:hemolysin activation/secretion protein